MCSTGNYCLTGFTLYEITTGIPVVIVQIPQTTTTYKMTPLPSKGSHSYEVVQNGLNGAGTPIQSLSNPGLVINCVKAGLWRTCHVGKSWAGVVNLLNQPARNAGVKYRYIRPRSDALLPAGTLKAAVQ